MTEDGQGVGRALNSGALDPLKIRHGDFLKSACDIEPSDRRIKINDMT